MNTLEWATNEVSYKLNELEKSYNDSENIDFKYIKKCYESALKAIKSLYGDDHSLFFIQDTKAILDQLIDRKPLSPIKETDEWEYNYTVDKFNYDIYSSIRFPALTKRIYKDGKIQYRDMYRTYGIFINAENEVPYTFRLLNDVIDEMFPMVMPYYPDTRYRVYYEEISSDQNAKEYKSVIFISHAIKEPTNERIEIGRYFIEGDYDNDTYYGYKEISKEEYEKIKLVNINK